MPHRDHTEVWDATGLQFLPFMSGYIQTWLYAVITATSLTPLIGTQTAGSPSLAPKAPSSACSSQKVFMSLSALVVPLLLLASGVGFLLLVFDGENVLLMKYNQYRITLARDEQAEVKQDQSMKGPSQKRVR